MAVKKKQTFEEGLSELEQLVERLEAGELPLDQSFKAYEQGIALSKMLEKTLDDGEKRIAELMELTDQGEKPFEETL
ncbi:MAG: exodeoxyribonuclease VII small subunit [Clostridia bacterium]